jgi:hypothetical protein
LTLEGDDVLGQREWSRAEIVPMDARGDDISVSLYREDGADGPEGVVHTYSSRPGAAERVATIARAMAVLGGLEQDPDDATVVRFPCGAWHAAAARRTFLEAVKIDPAELAPRPLHIVDRKTDQEIAVEPLGDGRYRVTSAGGQDGAKSRAPTTANGLRKLAELTSPDDDETVVAFGCGHEHDVLVGLLLPRAVNVRAAIREEEMSQTRGVLTAPSAQEPAP